MELQQRTSRCLRHIGSVVAATSLRKPCRHLEMPVNCRCSCAKDQCAGKQPRGEKEKAAPAQQHEDDAAEQDRRRVDVPRHEQRRTSCQDVTHQSTSYCGQDAHHYCNGCAPIERENLVCADNGEQSCTERIQVQQQPVGIQIFMPDPERNECSDHGCPNVTQ